jgi:hypothetical protein
MTIGQHIAFAPGHYKPETLVGRRLLAHELVHIRQQAIGESTRNTPRRRSAEVEADRLAVNIEHGAKVRVSVGAGIAPAFALADYQNTKSEEDRERQIQSLSASRLQSDLDEISEFLDRQTRSNEETVRLEQMRDRLSARLAVLLRAASAPPPKAGRAPGGKGRQKQADVAQAATPTSEDAPRILREQRSVPLTDPAEVQREVDRIVAWLQRPDVTPQHRNILQVELQNLAPQFEQARQSDSARRQTGRIQASLGSGGEGTEGLRKAIRMIEGIYIDPSEPEAAFIMDAGERIRIGRNQGKELRANAKKAMQAALHKAVTMSVDARGLYGYQKAVNDDSPTISMISGWLGGVDDPIGAMNVAQGRLMGARLRVLEALSADNLSGAVDPLVEASTEARRILMAVHAWQEGLISGAETAVTGLTFIRDCSAVIVISIGAVVAAPFVAGAVGAGGLGLTGAAATGSTIVGTGLTVGSGAGAVFGSADYAGQRFAGASHQKAAESANKVGKQRFIEGFSAGMGGATTRVASQAIGKGGSALTQFGKGASAQAAGNFVGGASASKMSGDDLDVAVGKGFRSAALGTISSAAGAPFAKAPGLQTAISAGTSLGVNYFDARSQGQTHEEALRNTAINAASIGVLHASPAAKDANARYEAKGQGFGANVRREAASRANQARQAVGAASLGLALSLSPGRSAGRSDSSRTPTTVVAGVQDQPPARREQAAQPMRIESAGARSTAVASSSAQSAIQEQAAMGFLDPDLAAPGANVATATARTPRSMVTGIRAQTAEITAYDQRLANGEVGILAPVGANVPGPDYATAVRLPDGTFEILVCDAKSRVSPTSQFGATKSSLPATWQGAISNSLAPGRLSLPDAAMEQAIRDAWTQGRVRIVRDTIDYSPGGQGQLRLDD